MLSAPRPPLGARLDTLVRGFAQAVRQGSRSLDEIQCLSCLLIADHGSAPPITGWYCECTKPDVREPTAGRPTGTGVVVTQEPPPLTPEAASIPTRQPGLAGRALWTFGGQFLSSGGNFLLTILVLSVARPAEFAMFSICLTTYLLLAMLLRAMVCVPVTLLYSEHDLPVHCQDQRAASGLAVAAGCAVSTAIVGGSPLTGVGRGQFLVLAVCLPFLFFQDVARYVSFARGRPSVAALSDGLWLALQAIGSLAAFATHRASATTLFGVWAAAGSLAGCLAGLQLHLYPRWSAALGWLRRHRDLCRRLVVECLVTSGGVYAVYYGLAAFAGAIQLGYFKAAQTLLGPMNVLLMGGAALGVPESVRARRHGPRLYSLAIRLSMWLVGITLVCGVTVFLALPTFGPHLFPSAWETARPLIPLFIVFNVAIGASTGPISGIRVLGHAAWIARARTASTAIVLAAGLPAATVLGANGALLGLSLAESLLAVAAWSHLHRLVIEMGTDAEMAG